MEFGYTPEQQALRDEIIRFARQELCEGVIERDRDQVFSPENWKKCAEMGLQGLPVPAELGGSGLDALSSAIALEALGYGCQDGGLVFSIVAHMVSCVVPLWKHGSPQHQDRYLKGLCDGTLVGVHAMTEPDSGSDAFAMRTRAEPDGDGWVINGSKIFISNGPIADVVIVFAVTDAAKGFHGGISSFLLERGHPGFEVSRKLEKMGLRTSPLGELNFDNVRVGPESLVGGLGGGSRMFTLAMDWERTCLFAAQVGVMERLLDTSVKYARSRKQFDQPIGKFQGVSHKIADMKVALEAARLLVYKAAWALDHKRSVTMDTSIAKLFVSEHLVTSALDAVQVHGGYGYMTEYEVERILRDAIGSRIYSGTSEMQRNIIAGWLGL